jgi:deoxyribonuclease V
MPRSAARSTDWRNITIQQARQIQLELSQQVILKDQYSPPVYVAGVDVGMLDNGKITRAAIAVLEFPSLTLADKSVTKLKTTFPYVPGYLSFRELPAVLKAIELLNIKPDIFLCDGQGIAHPRRFGIACHLGVLLDVPTIGVAKSRLTGTYQEPGFEKGDFSPLYESEEQIGVVLRTRNNVKPLFISPGHRVSIKSAMELTLACTTKYRLPETTRFAHKLASG